MADALLTINAGSSSLKFALFAADGVRRLSAGEVEGIGEAPHLVARDRDGHVLTERRWDGAQTHEAVLGPVLDWVDEHLGDDRLLGVGHRVVHGGPDHAAPEAVTPALTDALERLVPLAPLHQPHNLSPIRAITAARPGIRQVACFDTGFHATMPDVARRLPLPDRWAQEGLRRYGFHGLSYEYIAGRLRELDPAVARGRVVVAHLGNGASLCALRDGRSVETTMSFSALDGLVMGTRSGTIDPGVLLYLQQAHGMDADALQHLLYNESGLLGVSGRTGDMRELLGNEDTAARAAVELFVYRIVQETGALASVLGGLDAFVFTGGIGEHAAPVRAAVCERLGWLGAALDGAANERGLGRISLVDSRVALWAVATDEEQMIARHTQAVLGRSSG